jgi:hypothetical protein
MKTLAAVALSAFVAFPSFAGGLAPVEVEPAPIVVEESGSSVSPLLILGLLVLIGVLVTRNNDDDPQP